MSDHDDQRSATGREPLHHSGVRAQITLQGLRFKPHCSCGWEEVPQAERAAREHASTHSDDANVAAGYAYRCPDCGAVSYNPNDRENQYCGRCHEFKNDGARVLA